MRAVVFILMTSSFLFSSQLSKLYKMYEKQSYNKACDYANKYFLRHKKDEKFLTLYGLSCVETNHLSRVAVPMSLLHLSANARANASYLGTILLQKSLLMQALIDEKKIDDLNLPTTNFVLSKVFKLFVDKHYTKKEAEYRFKDELKEDLTYRLYMISEKKRTYMVLDIYQDEKFTKRYRYE